MKLLETLSIIKERTAQDDPEFRKWFAGSKVISPDGEPLMMFHGTSGEMKGKVFKPLSHFGTADAANDRLKWNKRTRPSDAQHVFPVYLSIKKPIRMGDTQALQGFSFELAERMANKGVFPKSRLAELEIDYNERGKDYIAYDEAWAKRFVEFLSSMGYDGVIYKNRLEDRGSDSYIIFHPSQVWPVFGNRPEQIYEALDPALEAFMNDLHQYPENPFDPKETRIGGCLVQVYPYGGKIHLGDIRVIEPRKGHGTRGLKVLTKLADKHGVRIEGEAQALGDNPDTMDQDRLVQWYKSMGFIVIPGYDGDYPEIEYIPNTPSTGKDMSAKIPNVIKLTGWKRPH